MLTGKNGSPLQPSACPVNGAGAFIFGQNDQPSPCVEDIILMPPYQ